MTKNIFPEAIPDSAHNLTQLKTHLSPEKNRMQRIAPPVLPEERLFIAVYI